MITPRRITLLLAFVTMTACQTPSPQNSHMTPFYLGTYSTSLGHVDGKGIGISLWHLDTDTGAVSEIAGPWPVVNSSHLCTSPDARFLYAISETSSFEGRTDGYLTSFRIDGSGANTSLTSLGTISSQGVGPAYVSLDRSGQFLLLANYLAGNIVVYPRQPDGSLGLPTADIMHEGSSVNPDRQEAPHPHAIVASPDNRYVLVPDLGLDQIKCYAFDEQQGTLQSRPEKDQAVPPGAGPRHLVFHPSGDFVYATMEMANQVAAYRFHDGDLDEIGLFSTLPSDFSGGSWSAEIRVSNDGRFVYAANRGHDSIAVFSVEESSGALNLVQTISTNGKTPRNFALDPSNRILVAGNQDSHSLITYRIDPRTGLLSPTGRQVDAASPVLFHFY